MEQLVGREQERALIDAFIDRSPAPAGLLLVGETGIGKTTLLTWAEQRARARGHRVIVMDDLHVLDAGASHPRQPFLRNDRSGVVLLGAARSSSPGDVAASPPPLWRAMERVDVGPMAVEDLRSLVASRLSSTLTRPELCRLHAMSGGNPLFALEIARTSSVDSVRILPGSAIAAVAEYVAALGADVVAVARCIAVAGPLAASVLVRAADVPDLCAAVREAVIAGVLIVDGDFTVRFTHPVFATAMLASRNPLDRRVIHGRLAEHLADRDVAVRHRARSDLGPDEALASDLEAAGARAAELGAADLAADDLRLSVRLTPATQLAPWSRRVLAEATCRAVSGQPAVALRRIDELLSRLDHGPLRTHALALRGVLDVSGSEHLLETALHTATDAGQRAHLLELISWQLATCRGRIDAAVELSADALALARADDDDELTMQAATTHATATLLAGRPAPELVAEAVELSAQLGPSPVGRWPRVARARHDVWNGRLSAARIGFERAHRLALGLGSELLRPARLADLAIVELAAGDLGLARRHAAEGIDHATDAGNERAITMLAHPLGIAAAHQGDQSTASWAADRLEWWAREHDAPPCRARAADIRGTLAAAAGDWVAAHAWFQDGVRVLHDLGYRHPGAIPVLPRAVEAACAAGHVEPLRRHVDLLVACAAPLDAPWVDAQAAYGRAALLLLDGRPEEARPGIARAAETVERGGHRLDATRLRLTEANACAAAGEPADARSLLGRCRNDFTMMGASGWVATIDGLTDRVATRRVASLTPTETCIARLVAAGRRNREIAAELYVSVSTVEAHLTRMYRKVGVRSRTGLAQLVAS